MAHLRFQRHGHPLLFPLHPPQVTLGRSLSCDLPLDHAHAALLEATLQTDDQGLWRIAPGAAPVLVNGVPHRAPVALWDQDKLELPGMVAVFVTADPPPPPGTRALEDREPPPSPGLHLKFAPEDAAARTLPLKPGSLTMGSGPDCDLCIQGPFISRRHATLTVDPSGLCRVTDNGSKNGVFVNQVRVREAWLSVGDRLRLGDAEFLLAAQGGAQTPVQLVGQSPAMEELRQRIARIAPFDAPVLIRGESGSGKDVAAQCLHRSSGRRGLFVAFNAAALSGTLAESELFGHVRGAFTGATEDKPGLLRHAQGGTLFIDEIGDMPLPLQTKLLRVVESRMVQPVGSATDLPVDTRFVFATHRDLAQEVTQGRFRQDLYYRINTLELHLPALRQRREDIGLLARYFLARFDPGLSLSSEALAALKELPWPGNVRELHNVVLRSAMEAGAQVLRGGVIDRGDLRLGARLPTPDLELTRPGSLASRERETIKDAVSYYGSKSRAAQALGIARSTLYKKMAQYGLD